MCSTCEPNATSAKDGKSPSCSRACPPYAMRACQRADSTACSARSERMPTRQSASSALTRPSGESRTRHSSSEGMGCGEYSTCSPRAIAPPSSVGSTDQRSSPASMPAWKIV